jgi:hypothetical protein
MVFGWRPANHPVGLGVDLGYPEKMPVDTHIRPTPNLQ